MNREVDLELKVGVFVTIGVGLLMGAILVLGGTGSLFSRSYTFNTHFRNVDGLINGAKVVLGGIQVGTVKRIAFDGEREDVKVEFTVNKDGVEYIRQNTVVEVATQGVLGDKYISLSPGSLDKPQVPEGSEIPNRPSEGLSRFLSRGDQLMVSLNSLALNLDKIVKSFETNNRSEVFFSNLAQASKNAASATEKLNRDLDDLQIKKISKNLSGILEKINNGTGTLGALVNDPGLYDDAKKLFGEANRNKIVRNLLRQTLKESEKKKDASE